MNYIGVDLHKNYSFIIRMNDKGDILQQMKVANTLVSLSHFLDTIGNDDKIALEATCN